MQEFLYNFVYSDDVSGSMLIHFNILGTNKPKTLLEDEDKEELEILLCEIISCEFLGGEINLSKSQKDKIIADVLDLEQNTIETLILKERANV